MSEMSPSSPGDIVGGLQDFNEDAQTNSIHENAEHDSKADKSSGPLVNTPSDAPRFSGDGTNATNSLAQRESIDAAHTSEGRQEVY